MVWTGNIHMFDGLSIFIIHSETPQGQLNIIDHYQQVHYILVQYVHEYFAGH